MGVGGGAFGTEDFGGPDVSSVSVSKSETESSSQESATGAPPFGLCGVALSVGLASSDKRLSFDSILVP
jgi:hypothetical protein